VAYLPLYTAPCYNTHEFPLFGVGRWCERAAWQRRYRHEAEVLLPIVHTQMLGYEPSGKYSMLTLLIQQWGGQ